MVMHLESSTYIDAQGFARFTTYCGRNLQDLRRGTSMPEEVTCKYCVERFERRREREHTFKEQAEAVRATLNNDHPLAIIYDNLEALSHRALQDARHLQQEEREKAYERWRQAEQSKISRPQYKYRVHDYRVHYYVAGVGYHRGRRPYTACGRPRTGLPYSKDWSLVDCKSCQHRAKKGEIRAC